MKSIRFVCGIVCSIGVGVAILFGAPQPASAEQPSTEQTSTEQTSGDAAQRLATCDRYMGAYTRSAARKLSRSLAGQKYTFSPLPEQSSLQVARSGDDQPPKQFELLFEKERSAAGVVEKTRTHRTTYVVAHYELGPLVAVHRWPSREAVASGKAECKPLSSRIAFPAVPVAEVDVDPFKFWGLRVVWHIPTDLPKETVETSPLEALKAVIESSD